MRTCMAAHTPSIYMRTCVYLHLHLHLLPLLLLLLHLLPLLVTTTHVPAYLSAQLCAVCRLLHRTSHLLLPVTFCIVPVG